MDGGVIVIDSSFWKDKKVFITGHSGFKGSWLSLWLSMMGAAVTGYALRPPSAPNLFGLCGIDQLIRSELGDVNDRTRLSRVLIESDPDVILHMAAQPIVRESYQYPVETYLTNVMGTVHVLDAVRELLAANPIKRRAFVNVTTDKVYDNAEQIWGYREYDRLGGYDPYSNSKACSELVTAAYRDSYYNPGDYQKHQLAVARREPATLSAEEIGRRIGSYRIACARSSTTRRSSFAIRALSDPGSMCWNRSADICCWPSTW
jgi:dTDP-D-glucose 4,6-dehydratase